MNLLSLLLFQFIADSKKQLQEKGNLIIQYMY